VELNVPDSFGRGKFNLLLHCIIDKTTCVMLKIYLVCVGVLLGITGNAEAKPKAAPNYSYSYEITHKGRGGCKIQSPKFNSLDAYCSALKTDESRCGRAYRKTLIQEDCSGS
jgi:hypothetical protein